LIWLYAVNYFTGYVIIGARISEEETSMKLDEIVVEGVDAEVDSFIACITAAIKFWGRDYDYEYIAGLAGTAFSPAWNENESCGAWLTELGNDMRIKFLGKALGFFVRESPDVALSGDGVQSGEYEKFIERVKEALQEGKIVIAATWPYWSIIKKWSDIPENIKLATLEGSASPMCALKPDTRLYILGPAPAEITRMEALREAIKFGADVADGNFTNKNFHFGGKLYEEILRRLRQDSFCEDCGERSCNCVHRTMERVAGINKSAASFLEFAGEFMGSSLPKPALENVVRGYRTISELAGSYDDQVLICENWSDKGFREVFSQKVTAIQETHRDASILLRRIADHLV
jgi:hypothetical protein